MSASNTPRTDAVERKYDDEEYRAAVDCLILSRYLERGLMELRAEFNAAVQVGASYEKQAARLREALKDALVAMETYIPVTPANIGAYRARMLAQARAALVQS